MALISKQMPERKRIVRFEIVFSHIPFLLRLSQITEPEPEPYPRPPRIRLKIFRGIRTYFDRPSAHTNPDLTLEISRGQWYSVLCRAKARKINSGESFSRLYL